MTDKRLLSDEEASSILVSLGAYVDGEPFSKDDAKKIIAWCEETRVCACLLQCALAGRLLIGIKDGEITFRVTPKKKPIEEELPSPPTAAQQGGLTTSQSEKP